MPRASLFLALLGGGVLTGSVAWAAAWGDFSTAYPKFPCQDGWMACVVDGKVVSPDLQGDGIPGPADLRVSWDLQPSATFSPFSGLSAYTGQLQATEAVADAAAEAPAEAPVEAPAEAPTEAAAAGTADAPSEAPSAPAATPTPAPARVASAPSSSGTASPTPQPSAPAGSSSVRPPSSGSIAAAQPASTTSTTPSGSSVRPSGTADAGAATPPAGAIQVTNAAVAKVAGDDTCDSLPKLEPQAMLGKLSEGQIACLEKNYAGAAKQTDKDKISRLMMANAYSKGDIAGWEKLMKRHLEEIDQSDPDLCYKYALHLSKGGAARATGVIKWANAALENRTVWTGDTYQSRVNSLYKLRAAAAQSMWKAAEEENAKSPSEVAKKKVDDSRSQTKVFAREWYEYCKAAGKDTTTALQLCTSAAGTKDYCEGA